MSKPSEWIIKQREQHHSALLSMLPSEMREKTTGMAMWRKLRRVEGDASRYALQLCNGPELSEADQQRIQADIRRRVALVFGGRLPKGFFLNRDPRGYALKLEPGSGPDGLHQDWGRYQILAPIIES